MPENQDSGFAGSDYPDIQAEVGEVAAMPSVAALRNTVSQMLSLWLAWQCYLAHPCRSYPTI